MNDTHRFELIFTKLREVVEEDEVCEGQAEIRVRMTPDLTSEELNDIEAIRQLVMEVNEPATRSYTTT